MSTDFTTYDVVHYYCIKVYEKRGMPSVESLSWTGLRWELRLKYDWYFKYRAALLQVRYPRYVVDCIWGNEPATGKSLEQIRQNKIRNKKAKITEYKNKLELARKHWSSLFPIDDDIVYKRAEAKINRLVQELYELNNRV
jgi:hypothetical protein